MQFLIKLAWCASEIFSGTSGLPLKKTYSNGRKHFNFLTFSPSQLANM